jgi:hypothetical protein
VDLSAETARWAIGGGLGALSIGVGFLLRMVWVVSATVTRIEDRLSSHGELHDSHAASFQAHDSRLRVVEGKIERHSGRFEATEAVQ